MPASLDQSTRELLERTGREAGLVLVMTGAGVSAESGIPTFRGPEGYWSIGSRHYHPQDLATHSAFVQMPEAVWAWYLYRRSVCRRAQPNDAHRALAGLEGRLGDRFLLVTQNSDGLHLRAGNTAGRTLHIHGLLERVRCARECGAAIATLPARVDGDRERGAPLTDAEAQALRCGDCGGWLRPHVLWFDEFYDEPNFHFDSALAAAARAGMLVVIGTSGATNLPMQVGMISAQRDIPFIVVNPEPSPFTEMAAELSRGAWIQATACDAVPVLCETLSPP